MAIQSLPFEILARVFEHLSADELRRHVAPVCAFWLQASSAEYIWREKCLKRWTAWAKMPEKNWKHAYEMRFRKERLIQKKLYNMCNVVEQEILEKSLLDDALESEEYVAKLVTDPSLCDNLTVRYWAEAMKSRLREKRLAEKWAQFFNRDASAQLLEEGAVLLCQWERENVLLEDVCAQLDSIADQVRSQIRPRGDFESDSAHEKEKIRALHQVLFEEMNFRGNESDYYNADNSYIDRVLDRRLGIPISLAVVHSSVARRIGLKIELIGFPSHLMVRYTSTLGEEMYIDVFAHGLLQNRDQMQARFGDFLPPEAFDPLPLKRVYIRMLSNLSNLFSRDPERLLGITNQMLAINPNDHRCSAQRAYLHLRHRFRPNLARMDANGALSSPSLLEPEIRRLEASFAVVFLRPTGSSFPKLRVGDVVRFSNDPVLGVVVGWDTTAYAVLFENNSMTQVPHSNPLLEKVTSPLPLRTTEVGRYFEAFKNGRYVPNAYTAKRFPDG